MTISFCLAFAGMYVVCHYLVETITPRGKKWLAKWDDMMLNELEKARTYWP